METKFNYNGLSPDTIRELEKIDADSDERTFLRKVIDQNKLFFNKFPMKIALVVSLTLSMFYFMKTNGANGFHKSSGSDNINIDESLGDKFTGNISEDDIIRVIVAISKEFDSAEEASDYQNINVEVIYKNAGHILKEVQEGRTVREVVEELKDTTSETDE